MMMMMMMMMDEIEMKMRNFYCTGMVWYGMVEFNVPLDTV